MGKNRKGKDRDKPYGFYESSKSSQTHSLVLKSSKDGRRVLVEKSAVIPTRPLLQPVTPVPRPRVVEGGPDAYTNDLSHDQDGLLGIDDVGEVVQITAADVALGRARRWQNSDFPLLAWIPVREEYLDEVIRLDGRGMFADTTSCPMCGVAGSPTIRCRDCFGGELLCVPCAVKMHSRNPLHMTEHFLLCHPPGKVCAHRQAQKDFVVIHANGIHVVNLDFCGCGLSENIERRQQILRMGWWPATVSDPQTAATFQCMNLFHLLSVQGKTTGYDFYKSLELSTSNSGLSPSPDRLPSFMIIARQWRHIMMMKRAGRGHDPAGIIGTEPGECAVICPACPHPGINLPEGWEDAPTNRRCLAVQVDRHHGREFRLKNRLRSSQTRDPGLNIGMAYFVSDDGYEEHLEAYIDQPEMSGCSRFAAIAASHLKSSKGLRVTGVGGIFCARHELWRANGLGDLQKGERYCNMDYIFLSSLVGVANRSLLVSYDIACQWSKNLLARVQEIGRFELPPSLDFVVPKFHLPAHREACHAPFGLQFKLGAGQTDGEAPERNWADMNGAAASTKEMGPGSRHSTLDDHCGHSNWRKFVGMLQLLRRRLTVAIKEASEHCDIYTDFTDALTTDHPETMRAWQEEIQGWEQAPEGRENPYHRPKSNIRMADVRLELAQEDNSAVEDSSATSSEPAVSAFVLLGLRIESLQLKHRLDSRPEGTSHQAAKVQESRTALLRLIRRFRSEQDRHMPRLSAVVDSDDSASTHTTRRPELIKLHLPSDLTIEERGEFCNAELVEVECRLRKAAMGEALDDVRHQLRFRTYMNKWKIRNVKGQRPNTRARATQARIEDSVKRAVETYRLNRKAYYSLLGEGDWQRKFRELKDEDVHGLGQQLVRDLENAEDEQVQDWVRKRNGSTASGESRYVLPWIWYSAGQGLDSDALEVGDGESVAAGTMWKTYVFVQM
ncbi:hypothetical protein BV25DRAFT_1921506 [Artomyces pyxidatus]|uniref:Uncharacterized protein n=1 Tax=Artomyces pyxidatus TaxID=48021 RepID=A0ACB8SJD5_9AGAM|nr:hypothetical protein BV25DRAFT_1921506 [Artomyces pyxidatus]